MNHEFNLQRYVRRPKQPGTILTVSGGKGGTGKTNISVNLAIALAQNQQEVVVLDADIGLANVEVLLGMKSRDTLQAVIEGRKMVSEILSIGPGGIRVAPGISGLGHLANLDKNGQCNVRLAMEELQRNFDFVIVDTMAGIGPSSVAFAVAADMVLLVATPEPSAMLDAYAMIKMIHGLNPRSKVHVLVNMVEDQRQAFRTMNRLSAASRKYLNMPLTYAGHIPWDPNTRAAVLQSCPFVLAYPHTAASRAIQRFALHLLDEPAMDAVDEAEPSPGFFTRFARSLGVA